MSPNGILIVIAGEIPHTIRKRRCQCANVSLQSDPAIFSELEANGHRSFIHTGESAVVGRVNSGQAG